MFHLPTLTVEMLIKRSVKYTTLFYRKLELCLKLTNNDCISSINWYQNLREMEPKLM